MAAMNSIDYCPTVRPSEKEFSNFLEYIEKIEKEYGDNYGMVKVIFLFDKVPLGKPKNLAVIVFKKKKKNILYYF